MPSFHFIEVAVIFVVPSSRKVKVLVSFVSSKYGLGLKFWKNKYKNVFKTTIKPLDISSQSHEYGAIYKKMNLYILLTNEIE